MKSMIDLHMHIVPGVDDGSRNMEESLQMLRLSEEQGITDVFCTSHNGYSKEDGELYMAKLQELKETVEKSGINIRLHKGCEILCAGEYMEEIIYGLEIGAFTTLGETKYILTELYPNARPSEALFIIDELKKHGYKPIIAHMERNYNITGLMVETIIQGGALIQVNAYSFVDEEDVERKNRARELLENGYVHFIGSDAHRIDHRPPNPASGITYILDNADAEYANKILSGNCAKLINNEGVFTMDNKTVNELLDLIEKYGLITVIHKTFGNYARMNLGFTKKVCDISIDELSLSVRGFNVLKRSNLNTIGDVIDAMNEKKLMMLRNLGEKTSREIKTKIVDFGYSALSEQDKKEFLLEIIKLNTK